MATIGGDTLNQNKNRDVVEGIVVDVQGPKSYERMEGEPTEWFTRFSRFMLQGPKRSLQSVYRAELAESGQGKPGIASKGQEIHVPGSWKEAAKKWDWYARVAAYDIDLIESEKKQVEADRAARRRQLLDDEWNDGQLMLSTARESLKHGHKFFERTTKLVPGKFIETEEIDPKTGKTVKVRTKIDREIVYIEHKVGDINRMLVDGGKKVRMSVGLTSEKAQEAFMNLDGGENMDIEAVDRELAEMFEQLGMNKRLPAPVDISPDLDSEAGAPQDDDLPGDIENPVGPPDEVVPGFDY